jgi:hypothetical protein
MDPVTIAAVMGTLSVVFGTITSMTQDFKTGFFDPIIWPAAKWTAYIIAASIIVMTVMQTGRNIIGEKGGS